MAKWTRKTTLALVELSKERPVYIDGNGRIRCPSPALIASRGGKIPKGWTRFVDDPRVKAELEKDANVIARDRLMAAIAESEQHDAQQSLRQASRAVLPRGKRKRDFNHRGGRR